MASIKTLGRYAWRKFALDGDSSSGFHEPKHPDIFAFIDKVDEQVAALAVAGSLKGEWDASSGAFPGAGVTAKGDTWIVTTAGTTGGRFFAEGDRIVALVVNASTTVFAANWGVVPANARIVVSGVDEGDGTANAIQVTTEDAVANGTVVVFSLYESTTSSPVTVSINGGASLTLKTNRGNNASALTAGMEIWGRYSASDSTFRMLNDQDVSALVAQAEAARDAAELAASTIDVKNVADRDALALLDMSNNTVAISREMGGDSEFIGDTSDLSDEVALDPGKIGYVPPSSDVTGASGAWRRNLRLPRIYPEDAGVFGDDVDRPGHVLGMQRAIDFAAREGCVLTLRRGGLYRIPGPMVSRSNLSIEREPGAILFPTEWSQYAGGGGQFFGNVFNTADPNEMAQRNVRFDLHIDGSLMPTRTLGFATAGSSNTVTLDEEFDGKIRPGLSILTILLGTGSTQALRVQSWDAGTRVATMVSNWTTPPDATSYIGEGSNDNAMAAARGAFDWAGSLHVENFPPSWVGLGSGGKAFNAEQGCRHFDIEVWAKRCGWGGFIQGRDGTFAGYSAENIAAGFDRRWSRDIRLRVYAEECEIGVGIYGATSDSDPDGDPRNNFAKVDAVLRNCGHATSRPLISNKNVKCAPIVIAEGQNFQVDAMVTMDDDFVFNWPASDALLAGAGITGGLGSVVEGWGRNGRVKATFIGEVDYLYTLDNVRAGGEDASASGIPKNVFGFDVDITHRGGVPATSLFIQRATTGNTDPALIAMRLTADVDYIPTSVIGANLSYDNIHVDVHARSLSGAQEHVGVSGSALQIRANRNDLTGLTGFYDMDVRRMDRGLSIGAGGPVISKMLHASVVHDFGTVAAHTEVSTTISVPGAVAGTKTFAEVTFNGARVGGLVFIAQVTADDTVTLYCLNATAASIAAINRTYSLRVIMIA